MRRALTLLLVLLAGTLLLAQVPLSPINPRIALTTITSVCTGTCYYIRAGGSASTSGTGACVSTGTGNWATGNACAALPATLVRGATYYVADGAYSGRIFTTAASGTTLITIQKATVGSHGDSTGWSDAFGDGQATFAGQLEFDTRYWVFDGKVGGGPPAAGGGTTAWKSGHGFKITETASTPVFFVNGGGNVTLSHTELAGAGNNGSGGDRGNDSLQVLGGTGAVDVSYVYAHDAGRCQFYHAGGSALTVSYSYFGQYESTSGEHSEFAILRTTAPFILRWSVITHEEGTGGIIAGDDGTSTAEIYGNVFYDSGEFGVWGSGNNGLIGAFTLASAAINWKVYNNTFVNMPTDLSVFGIAGESPSGNVASNNYFYTSTSHDVITGWTQSFNHFQDSSTATGSNSTTGSGDPFVAFATYDFGLNSNTTAGTTLAAPYNTDWYGRIRGATGAWTRGAIQVP